MRNPAAWLASQSGVAAAYFLFALLSLQLGVAPVMTRPLWFPAALVAGLVFSRGLRDLPGLCLGAMLFGWYRYYDTQGVGSALFNALGVGMQMVIAHQCLSRWMTAESRELWRLRDLVVAGLIMGPLMMSIRPLVLFPFLLSKDLIPWYRLWDRYLEWVATDSLSAMLAAPIVLVFFAKPRDWWWQRRYALLFAQGFIVVGFVSALQVAARLEFFRVQANLQNELTLRIDNLSARLDQINALPIETLDIQAREAIWIEPNRGGLSIPLQSTPNFVFSARRWLEHEQTDLAKQSSLFAASLEPASSFRPFTGDSTVAFKVQASRSFNGTPMNFAIAVPTTRYRELVSSSLWWFQFTFSAAAILATIITLSGSGSNRDLERRVQTRTASLEAATRQLRLFKAISDQATDGIVVSEPVAFGEELKFIYANNAFFKIVRLEPGDAFSVDSLRGPDSDPAQFEKMQRAMINGKACSLELFHYRKNGERFIARLDAFPIFTEQGEVSHWAGIYRDVSNERIEEQRKRNQERDLAQRERNELIGRMAGGVAHDFNNLLTAIQGSVEMIRLESDSGSGTPHDLLESIEAAVTTGSELTHQLLAFSGRGAGRVERVDLNDKLRTLQKMLQIVVPADVRIQWTPSKQPLFMALDPASLSQLMVNLVVNSAQAMPASGPKRIHIETFGEQIIAPPEQGAQQTGEFVVLSPEAAEGPHAILQISDSGSGIPAGILTRIFEPFFSTKSEGTGLGLAAVIGVVKHLRGWLHVRSHGALGGAEFRIHLPITDALAPTANTRQSDHIRGKRALIVDDEPAVRAYTSAVLKELGLEIEVAEDGLAAKAKLETQTYDVLLTDMTMPKMGGGTLIEWLVVSSVPVKPKILVMSGFVSERDNISIEHEQKILRWLNKPFSAAALSQAILEVLRDET
jgi:signal transduction histidine kinase/ActR/RegA family two-component response regulator